MADNNSIVVPITIDAQKAEVTLQKFQTTLQTFTNNYSQTTSNIYQLSERSTWSFSKLATTIADTGFAFSNIKSVISSLANSYMSFTDTLSKMSQRTGIAAESLGGLKFAAEQSGANFDILSQGLKTFQQQLANVQNGKNTLGIDATTDTEEALMQFADRIKNMTSQTQQVKAATEAFGKAGYKLLPMLQEGREGIQKLKDEAKRLGMTLDETAIQEGVKLTDATNRMKQSFAGVSNQIIASLAPSMTVFFDTLSRVAGSITSMVNRCPVLISTLGKMIVAFLAFSGVLRTIPVLFTAITAHPIIATLAALALVIAGVNAALSPTPAKFDAITHSAQAQREELDGLIAADKDRMARLKDLQAISDSGTLNNEEMSEAATLVGELSSRYGDLGISVDTVTGKIRGVEEANRRMYQDMVAQRRKALEEERAELERNLNSLRTQKTNIENKNLLQYGYDEWISGKNKEERENYDRQIEAVKKQLEEVNNNLNSVDSSVQSIDATTKNGKSPGQIKREIEAQKTLISGDTATAEFNKSDKQKELDAINAETAKYDAAFRVQNEMNPNDKLYGLDDPMMRQFYEHMKNDPERRKKLKGSKREMYNRLAFLDMQEQKKAAVEKKYADKEAKEAEEKKKAEQDAIESQARIDELVAKGTGKSTKLIQLEREHNDLYNNKWLNDEWQENTPDAERNKTHKRMMAVRQAIKEEQTKLKEQSGVTDAENKVSGLQETIDKKTVRGDLKGIDELRKQLDAAKLELAKTVANVSGKAREEARAELNKQRAEYKTLSEKDGVSEDELAKKWKKVEEAEANFKKQDSEYSSAVGKIQAAQEERANNQISQAKQTIETATSQGTFSAWEVGSIGNNTARQQLDTMKKMLDELIKINKNTEEGAVVA